MTIDRDVTRIVRSWLQVDEHESADRVLDNVLAVLDATPQRRIFWPARRIADMNAFAKFLIAAAAVVVAVVGISQLPASTAPTGSGVTAPPSATASSPRSSQSAEPSALVWRDLFSLQFTDLSTDVRYGTSTGLVAFSVPTPGWFHFFGDEIQRDISVARAERGEKPTATITFSIDSPDGVYSDPCQHVRRDPVGRVTETDEWPDRLQHSADLAAALATIPGTNLIDGPSDVTVGELPAKHVALSVRDDIACPGAFYLWYDWDRPSRSAPQGQTIRIWIVDYLRFRTRTWIEAWTPKGAAPELDQEIQQIVDSIQFAG